MLFKMKIIDTAFSGPPKGNELLVLQLGGYRSDDRKDAGEETAGEVFKE